MGGARRTAGISEIEIAPCQQSLAPQPDEAVHGDSELAPAVIAGTTAVVAHPLALGEAPGPAGSPEVRAAASLPPPGPSATAARAAAVAAVTSAAAASIAALAPNASADAVLTGQEPPGLVRRAGSGRLPTVELIPASAGGAEGTAEVRAVAAADGGLGDQQQPMRPASAEVAGLACTPLQGYAACSFDEGSVPLVAGAGQVRAMA